MHNGVQTNPKRQEKPFELTAMNACLSNYLVVDAIRYTLFFGYICVLLPLRELPRKFITEGVCT
jgi:hypothetical protein